MFLDGHRVLPGKTDQLEQHAQQVLVVLMSPLGTFEYLAKIFDRVLDFGNRIADEKSPDSCTHDHRHFKGQRLEDDPHLAASSKVSSKNHHENGNDPDDANHQNSSLNGVQKYCRREPLKKTVCLSAFGRQGVATGENGTDGICCLGIKA